VRADGSRRAGGVHGRVVAGDDSIGVRAVQCRPSSKEKLKGGGFGAELTSGSLG
jgi:hypothetical protein